MVATGRVVCQFVTCGLGSTFGSCALAGFIGCGGNYTNPTTCSAQLTTYSIDFEFFSRL